MRDGNRALLTLGEECSGGLARADTKRKRKRAVVFVLIRADKMGTASTLDCVVLGFLLAALACTSASSDVFDAVLGNTVSCHKTCQMTYSLHTYPRVSPRLGVVLLSHVHHDTGLNNEALVTRWRAAVRRK